MCKGGVSVSRHGEQALRALVLVGLLGAVAVACHAGGDLGFDVVAVPSAAYLPYVPPPEGGVRPDGGREAGPSDAPSRVVHCEPPPDEFDPSEEIEDCPATNDDDWPLDPEMTNRRRNGHSDAICCFRRPPRIKDDDRE